MTEDPTKPSLQEFFNKAPGSFAPAAPAAPAEKKMFHFSPVGSPSADPMASPTSTDTVPSLSHPEVTPTFSSFPTFTVEAGPVSPTFSANEVAQIEPMQHSDAVAPVTPSFAPPEPAPSYPSFAPAPASAPQSVAAAPQPIMPPPPPPVAVAAPQPVATPLPQPVMAAPTAPHAPTHHAPKANGHSGMVVATPNITIPQSGHYLDNHPEHAILMPVMPDGPASAAAAPKEKPAPATPIKAEPTPATHEAKPEPVFEPLPVETAAPAPLPVEFTPPPAPIMPQPVMAAPAPQPVPMASMQVQAPPPPTEDKPAALQAASNLYRYEASWQKMHVKALEDAEKVNELVVNTSNINSKLQSFLDETVEVQKTQQLERDKRLDAINPAAINNFHAALYEGVASQKAPATAVPTAAAPSPLSNTQAPQQPTGHTGSRFADRLKTRIETSLKAPAEPAQPEVTYIEPNFEQEKELYSPPPYPADPSKE